MTYYELLKFFGTPEHWRIAFEKVERSARKHLYYLYLQSVAWQKKRDMCFERSIVCERCRFIVGQHVHHINYSRVGDEHLQDLMVVCEHCHKVLHGLAEEKRKHMDYHSAKDIF